MPEVRKAGTLQEAYRNLDPVRPLVGEWLEAFYVPRPPDSRVDQLQQELLLDDAEDDKTLFSGQQGAGETTELHRLAQALKDTHVVILLNAEKVLNLGDVHFTDLLVTIGLAVYEEARRRGVPADDQQVRDLLFWYEEQLLERDETTHLKSEVAGEVNVGVARFGVRLAQESPFRKKVRAQAEARLSDLITRLNALLASLRQRFHQRILVIVDGMDKVYDLKQATDLFLHGANALMAPACRIIYTVPFPLFYSPDFQQVRQQFHRNYLLPNVKTRNRDGTPCEPGRRMLREVLLRRMDQNLIDLEALERLVDASGGLLRELLRLARFATLLALTRVASRVERQDVEGAMRKVRNTFRRILKAEDYRYLWKIHETRNLAEIPADVADRLLHNLSVLEYNGDVWWDIHPAVKALLEETGEHGSS